MIALCYLVTAIGLLVSLPAWSLLLLTVYGRRRSEITKVDPAPMVQGLSKSKPRVAVLVPAHNESTHVLPTIQCLLKQLSPDDRLLVIADNCDDDTAELAARAGAMVVERHDTALRGKGYALAFGVGVLRADPPDVVVVVDADCIVSDQAISRISAYCVQTGFPVQMLDLMRAPQGAGLRIRILEFAWLIKNQVRPLGTQRLGGVCHLMGTGMAIPWKLISTAQLATGHIAEDMKLGVDLALAGYPAQFFNQVHVASAFPTDSSVARAQKSRWEHGHLTILKAELPRLLAAALCTGRISIFVLALDLLIPPLALYFLLLAVMVPLTLVCGLLSSMWQPVAILMFSTALAFGLAIGMSWWRYARELISLRELVSTPLYAFWKIPVYIAYATRRRSGWVRTRRN